MPFWMHFYNTTYIYNYWSNKFWCAHLREPHSMTTEPRIKHRFPPKSQDPFPSQFGRTASRSDPGRQGRWFPPLDPRDYSFGAGPAAIFFFFCSFFAGLFPLSVWLDHVIRSSSASGGRERGKSERQRKETRKKKWGAPSSDRSPVLSSVNPKLLLCCTDWQARRQGVLGVLLAWIRESRQKKKQITGCKWITENPIASSVSSILYWNTKTG